MKVLRPTNLESSIYKILVKVWANRFKGVMGDMVSNTQNACIQGR